MMKQIVRKFHCFIDQHRSNTVAFPTIVVGISVCALGFVLAFYDEAGWWHHLRDVGSVVAYGCAAIILGVISLVPKQMRRLQVLLLICEILMILLALGM